MIQINENSGLEFKARFYSEPAGALLLPSTCDWKLVDEASGEVLQDWTTVAISSELSDAGELADAYALIEVSGLLNDCDKNYEIKILTVAADRSTAREFSRSMKYRVNKVQ